MSVVLTRSGDAPVEHRRLGLTLALLAFAQLIISIDYNIVFVALPAIATDLGFTDQTGQWIVSAYALLFGGLLLLGGRAADLLGKRRMFMLGLLLYAVSSLVGGLATDPAMLLAARAVQGLGGAFLFPSTLALISTSFAEGHQRNRAFSVWAAAGGSGMILGSLLGGVLTQAFGWRAVFLVNVPLAGAALLLASPLIAPDDDREPGRRFDVFGGVAGTVAVTAVIFALVQGPQTGWSSGVVLSAFAVGLVLLAAFLRIEARSRDPLMPLHLFRIRSLSVGVLTTFLFMATFGTLLYFLTVFYQDVRGYGALRTGCAFLPPMAAVFAGSAAGGALATRFGARATLIASLCAGIVGTVAVASMLDAGAGYLVLLPGLIVLSAGQGVIFTVMFAAASNGVAPHEQGVASGLAATGQQLGSAFGLAVLVAIANAVTNHATTDHATTSASHRAAVASGSQAALFASVIGMVVMIGVAACFARRTPRPGKAPAETSVEA